MCIHPDPPQSAAAATPTASAKLASQTKPLSDLTLGATPWNCAGLLEEVVGGPVRVALTIAVRLVVAVVVSIIVLAVEFTTTTGRVTTPVGAVLMRLADTGRAVKPAVTETDMPGIAVAMSERGMVEESTTTLPESVGMEIRRSETVTGAPPAVIVMLLSITIVPRKVD